MDGTPTRSQENGESALHEFANINVPLETGIRLLRRLSEGTRKSSRRGAELVAGEVAFFDHDLDGGYPISGVG